MDEADRVRCLVPAAKVKKTPALSKIRLDLHLVQGRKLRGRESQWRAGRSSRLDCMQGDHLLKEIAQQLSLALICYPCRISCGPDGSRLRTSAWRRVCRHWRSSRRSALRVKMALSIRRSSKPRESGRRKRRGRGEKKKRNKKSDEARDIRKKGRDK